jgi:hypothetical protein
MGSEHLSPFTLMRLLGEEVGDERPHLEAHLESCPACAAALAEQRAIQDEGARRAPGMVEGVARGARASRPLRRPLWLGLAAAGACAVALAIVRPPVAPGGFRLKGASRFEFACRDGGRVWRCGSGERVEPGTGVGIRVVLDAPGWLVVLGRDSSRRWRSYLPGEGESAVPAATGASDPLGQSLVLDGSPGEERFVVVVAPRPFRWAELLDGADAEALRLPDGFESGELRLTKSSSGGGEP